MILSAKPPATEEARVVAAHGRHLSIADVRGGVHAARVFGRGVQVVCGDRVTCRHDAQHDIWYVLRTLPRRSELHRGNARGRSELIAANVDLLVVVLAPLPEPDLFIVDRYLAAAAAAPAGALLLQNKSDLSPAPAPALAQELQAYARAGYALLHCSTRSGAGLDELRARLRGHTALLVGQSGVGKSSLLRTLVPDNAARIGDLMRDSAGRHTTTATSLHALPGGGELLDSPGVRDFAPALERLEPRSLGFVEIEALAVACRFANCRHYDEPGCAVRAAVADGALSARRYEGYRRLRRVHDDFTRRLRSGGH